MAGRTSGPVFVGRTVELERADAALVSAAAGQPAALVVSGDAGIGKSRFIAESCTRARAAGWRVATGVASPVDGRGLPYGPVVGGLRDLERQLDPIEAEEILGPALHALGLHPPGAEADAGPEPSVAGPLAGPLGKTWLMETLLQAVVAAAESFPTVLVFEDLHWTDGGTLGLIDYVIRTVPSCPLVLLCSYRSDEVGRDHPVRELVLELGRNERVTTVALTGLSQEEVGSLLTTLLGRRPKGSQLETVATRTAGNPFFVEELVAAGDVTEWSPAIGELVLARVERLSGPTRRLLGVAAVMGPWVNHELLASLSGLGDGDLDDALGEAVEGAILEVDDGGSGYRFRHELLREAVYRTLLPGQRARLHHQVAAMLSAHPDLSALGPGYAEAELAGHWFAAGEWAKSFTASVRAAEAARDVFAFEEADAHFERAIDCAARLDSGLATMEWGEPELLLQAADAAYLAGLGPRSMALAEAAVERIDVVADPLRAARGYVQLARNRWSLARPEECFRALDAAAALVPASPPTVELAMVGAEKARSLMLMSRFVEAEAVARDAVDVARAAGARAEEGHALNTLGCIRGALGHHDEGEALLHEALRIAEELAGAEDLIRAYANLTQVTLWAGRPRETARLARESAEWKGRLGRVLFQSAACNGADAMVDLGQWDEAEGVASGIERMHGNCVNHPSMILGTTAMRRGSFEQARRLLDDVDGQTVGLDDVQFRATLFLLKSELAILEGRPEEAYEAAQAALSLSAASDDELVTVEMCAAAARALADAFEQGRRRGRRGDEAKTRVLVGEIAKKARSLVDSAGRRGGRPAPKALGFALQCAAEERRLEGSDPSAWATAATHWDGLSMPYHSAYCRYREAEALLSIRSSPARAASSIRAGWLTCVELGAQPLRGQLESLAARAKVELEVPSEESRRRVAIADDLGLTAREVEVLAYLSDGRSDGDIAEALFISKKTASVHVSNLLRKLDLSGRRAAGELARDVGLSVDPSPGGRGGR